MERTLHPDSALLLMLRPYLNCSQRLGLIQLLCGEESAWYRQRLREMLNIISGIPSLYATDGQGEAAIAELHYFTPQADFYFTELDRESADLPGFGLAIITDAELGYLNLTEVLANGGELDLHWTPQTIGEIREGRHARATV